MGRLGLTVRSLGVGAAATCLLCVAAGPGYAWQRTVTDFEGFTLNQTINGQNGWSETRGVDEEIVDDGTGNTVWRVSNAITAGSFGDMPIAPRLGGIVTDAVNAPVNNSPGAFAGETGSGAALRRYFQSFDFKSATGAAQPDLYVTISADNGSGGRQTFVGLVDTGGGIDVVTYDVDTSGNFVGPITIASNLSYTEWHSVQVELVFNDGPSNDVATYTVDGNVVHTGTSWEDYYPIYEPGLHHNDLVPVQTLLVRLRDPAGGASGVLGQGFYIDNVVNEVGQPPEEEEPEHPKFPFPFKVLKKIFHGFDHGQDW